MIVNCDTTLILTDKEFNLLNDALILLDDIHAKQSHSPCGLYATDTRGNSLDDLFSDLEDAATNVYMNNIEEDCDDEFDFYDEDEDEEEEE